MLELATQATGSKRYETEALPFLPQLYSAARRLTRSEADAEDLVQDTYLRGFMFYGRFQEGTNLRAWMFKIMTNLFINKYRRRMTEARVMTEGRDDQRITMVNADLLEYCKDPEGRAMTGLFGDDVQRALDALNDDFRMVVLLADLEDFSYKEIAEMLGCPVGTVMSRLFRGRRALQKSLGQYARARGIGLGTGEAANQQAAAGSTHEAEIVELHPKSPVKAGRSSAPRHAAAM